jgi:predicted transposase/invertase (TIGR01784 family)
MLSVGGTWVKFFAGGSEEEMEMLGRRDAGVRKAVELLKALSGSEAHRRRAELREKARRDQRSREQTWYMEGLTKGKEDGLALGMEKRAKESARKMKADGVPVGQISVWTGLSPEEINQLQG